MCEYCEEGKPLYSDEHGTVRSVAIEDGLLIVACGDSEGCTEEVCFYIDFCPKCGKHLAGIERYEDPRLHVLYRPYEKVMGRLEEGDR